MRTRASSWGHRALLIAVLAAGLVSARVVLANSTAPAPPAQAAAARPALPACTIVGTNGPDTIVGTPGDDVICAKGGDDVVRGGGGNDVIFGSRGRDTLFGGPGDDKLYGGEGNDRLYGGGGRDFLQGGHGSDLISGGGGRDTVDYALRVGPVRVALGGSARNGAPGERDVIASDVENVLGGKAADVLIGDGRANALHGNGGADVLKGRGGNDALFGDRGNDRLTGGRGDDRLFGGRGRDRLDARDARRFLDRLNCGGGRADTALADAPDRVSRNCERVHRGRARNHAPTNIVLSKHSVAENQPVGTTVGRLSAVDRDRGDRHTFALVSGAGSADNASFRIDGSRLVTKTVFDFETKHSYSVRIRVTDRRGRSFAKSFTISVTDLPENHAPAAASKLLTGVTEDGSKSIELSGSDPDGDALTFHVAQPAHGHVDTTTPAASCAGSACTATVVYTPDANYNGPDGFSYKVNDGTSDSADATVTVTIDPVNDAPVAGDTDVNVQERTATPVDLGAVVSDVETSDADLTYTIVSQPGHGTLIVGGPTLTYTPNGGFNGSDSFTYNVTDRGDPDNCSGSPPACDGPKTSPTRTVSLAVAPVNDTPEARDATKHVSEDHALAVDLTTLASDTETSATNLNYTIVDGPAHGSLTGSGPNQTYTPNANFNGTDQFTYEVTDRGDPDNCGPAGPGCAAAKTSTAGTVAIVVDPVNDAPTATDASLSTDEGTPAPVDLGALVSDLETSDANLIYTIVSGPSHGHLTGSGTSRTYTPDPNFNGSDSFTYKVTDRGDPDGCSGGPPGCDAPLSSQTQTVSITVPPVNAAPVAGPGSVSATEDTPKAIDLSNFASDVETSPANLTYEVVDGPLHGTLAGSGASLTYTPNPNYNGPDQLTYQVTDRGDPDNCGPAGPGCAAAKTSTVGTVAITVAPVNDTPTASDTSLSTDEDTSASIDLAPLVSDLETSDANLTYEIVSGPAHGQLTANGTSQTYTPDASFNGTDQFTYRVTDRGDPDNCGAPGPGCDGPNSSATRTVSITVAPGNSPPVAGNGTATTDEDAATGIDLTGLAADVETGAANLTYTIVTGPAHGTLTGSGGSRTYTPDPDYNGPDSFTYTVTDRGDPDNCGSPGPGCAAPLTSATGTVSITVNPVNDAPVNTVPAGPLTAVQDTNTPITGASILDIDANTDDVQLSLSATHGNLTVSTSVLGGVGVLQVVGNNTKTVVVTASQLAINTTLADANGLVYHSDAAYTGPDTVTFTTNDLGHNGSGGPLSDTDTLGVTVVLPNHPPVAGGQSISTNEDTAKAITLSASDADGDDPLSFAIATQPTHGTLGAIGAVSCDHATPNTCTASVTYTPAPNYNGADSFTFTANDGRADSSPATVGITVNPVDDAPALANIESGALPYTENDPATAITATTTVSDIDSPNFDTGTLTVDYSAGGTVDDRLEIQDQGTGAGDIGVSGSSVTYGGTPIGTFAGGGGTSPLVVTLNANATPTSTQALVRAITYRNVSDNPTASRTVRFALTDGDGGTSNAATRQISVTAVNDPPVVAGIESPAVNYVESVDSPPSQSQITNNLSLSDPDNANLAGATAQITSGCQSGEDSLVFTNQNGITGTYTGATCVLTLTGSSSVANYQAALRSIKYQDSSDTPNTTTRTITFQADDGQGANHASNTQSRDVTVTPANDSPAAAADVFNGTNSALAGVTLAVSTSPSTANVAVTGSLLSNDTDPDTPHANLTASAGTSSANGGVVAVNADGSFSYTPAPGFTGTDTFTYTTHDNGSPDRTSTATVTINVAGPHVWFVNPGGAAGGNGTSLSPFASLGPLSTSGDPDVAGDVIFVYQGTGNATSSGFTLEGNQRLVGQPQGLSVTNANGTYNLVTAGGANPTITNSSGAGLTLADGDTIQRVDVKNSSGVGVTGNAIGTLTYGANSTISGNAGGGLALSGAAGGAIDVGADISSSAGRSVSIANRNSGTTSLTGAVSDTGAGILLSSNTGATISFTGALSASTGASDAFTATGGGTINVSTGATRNLTTTTGTALTLNGVGGAIGLTDLDKNGAGTGISVTAASASVTVASGATIANTTTAGVTIDQGTGAFTYAGTITNSSGRAVQVTNRNAGAPGLVQFTGSITSTGGTGVNLDNNDNGTISFSGGLVLSTGGNPAFTATNGGTVNVDNTGVVNTLTTTTATALNVASTNIGATGLKFQSISAGTASGSAGDGIVLDTTGASGGLTVTGTSTAGSGGTIQHKTGADSSTSAGIGIYLNNTNSVSLARMQLNDFDNFAIRGTGVGGFTLSNSTINGSNGTSTAADEASVAFDNLTGSGAITNDNISGGVEDDVRVQNTTGSLTSLSVTGSTFATTGAATANDALALLGKTGASVFNATVQNNSFTRAQGDLYQYTLETGTGTMHFDSNTVTNNFPTTLPAGGGDINISSGSVAAAAGQGLQYSINNNNIYAAGTGGQPPNGSVIVAAATPKGSATGTIQNNTIGTTGVTQSGGFDAILADAVKAGFHKVTITGNTIRRYKEAGIRLLGVSPAPSPGFNVRATVKGNVITEPDSIAFAGIDAEVGADPSDVGTMCLDLGGTTAADKNSVSNGDPGNFNDINLIQQFATSMNLPGYTGAATDDAAVQSFVMGRNNGDGTPTVSAIHDTTTSDGNPAGSGFTNTGTDCS